MRKKSEKRILCPLCTLRTQCSIHLKAFKRFKDTTDALDAATQLVESKLSKDLKKVLKKNVGEGETLGVADAKLGTIIKVHTATKTSSHIIT
jgi:hypothetical protein